VEWQAGHPYLLSNSSGTAQTQSRLWAESEYGASNDSQLLQIHSPAPGAYPVFGYTKNLQFHGKPIPDRITIYTQRLKCLRQWVAHALA
jgi:hypothetical protein